MKKRLVALTLTCALAATALAGCGGSTGGDSTASGDSTAATETSAAATETSTAEGSVYYLNFKPEQDQQWQDLAKAYTEETGVPVTVVTAASGNYETTLMSEMGKSGAPTLFQVNGPVGLANWKDYCYDLSGSDIYGQLTSDNYALKEGDTVYGVAYVIESYGLITNKTLLEKAGYTIDDIKSFADLKKVAEDITARSSELGFAAFTSAGMDGSSDWRFKTHLANLPIYFEYQTDGISSTDAIKGTYLDNYRDIWDLYINNSTCDPAELSAKTGDDSRNEFLAGDAVFFQNGSWEYGNLTGEDGYTDDDLAMIPIYIGAGDEANQGLSAVVYNGSQLASVKDVFNAILVRGDAVGDVCFYGPGAGKLPTASAVVADIIDCAKHSERKKIFGWGAGNEDYVVDYKERIEMPFYVRAKATPAEINAKFSDVKFLSRKGQPSDEVAFITDIMTENKLNKKLDGINVINTIKVTNY